MSKLFFRDKPIIGLDISQTGIKVMSIDPKRLVVQGYGSLDLDPNQVQDSIENQENTYLATSIKSLLDDHIVGTLPSNHVVLGVPTNRCYSHTFTIPKKAEKTLRDSVELEVEQYIPVPYSSLYVDYKVIERAKDSVTATLAAAPKKIIDCVTASAKAAGLRPVMIEPSIDAVGRILEATENANLPTLIVDIGSTGTDIAIFDNGAVRVTGYASVGGNSFTLAIAKKLGIELENAHQLKVLSGLSAGPRQAKITGALAPALDKINTEILKVLRYYSERLSSATKIEQVLIVGGGANVPGIGEYFTNSLVMPARVAVPWQKLNFGKLTQPNRQYRSRYITVAGLASIPEKEIFS